MWNEKNEFILESLFSLIDKMYDFENGIFFENCLISLVAYIKLNQQFDNEIADWIILNIKNKTITNLEIIPFCMHEFRWEKIHCFCESELEKSILQNDWKHIDFLRNILDSYNDNWIDIDMYRYFTDVQQA